MTQRCHSKSVVGLLEEMLQTSGEYKNLMCAHCGTYREFSPGLSWADLLVRMHDCECYHRTRAGLPAARETL